MTEVPTPDTAPMRTRLVNARLLTLLMVLRLSAELRYGRAFQLTELQRRIIAELGKYGGLTSIELVALIGHEKAQISRAVRFLSDEALIDRTSLRAPITLSDRGQALFDEVIAISRERNDALTRGIPRAEVTRFTATTQFLTERAALLLGRERDASAGEIGEGEIEQLMRHSPMPERLRGMAADPVRQQMVAPPLIALSAYLSRSATIAYRRESGLSNFCWQMLSQIGEHQPITLARLISLCYRDKSQVGRTVKWLESEGLIDRRPVRGRRDVMLSCTEAGNRLYAQMCDSARRRDDFLFAERTAEDRRAYIATLDKLTANAEALLAQERAIAGGG